MRVLLRGYDERIIREVLGERVAGFWELWASLTNIKTKTVCESQRADHPM
jgi:hypothetical protein